VTLALKSVANGLCKASNLPLAKEELIEQLVATVFTDQMGYEANDSMKLRINTLVIELSSHPDIR
jgi:hypothetical protein